jgi:hypothetical protein
LEQAQEGERWVKEIEPSLEAARHHLPDLRGSHQWRP